MIQRNLKLAGIMAALTLAMWGCGGSQDQTGQPPAPGDSAALMAEWRALVEGVPETLSQERPMQIALEMLGISPDAVRELVKVLEDPAEDPRAKVLAYTSLMPIIDADTDGTLIVDRVLALTDPAVEPTSRACALKLLSQAMKPEWEPLFTRNLDDPDSRVRLSAASGLSALGDAGAHSRLSQVLNNPDTPVKEREQAAIDLLKAPGVADLPDMMLILKDAAMPETLRNNAAAALGRMGTPDILDELEMIATNPETPAAVQEIARSARMAIVERHQTELTSAATEAAPIAPETDPPVPEAAAPEAAKTP